MFPLLLPPNFSINSAAALNIADFNQLQRENASDSKDINDASHIYNTPVILLGFYPKSECLQRKKERARIIEICVVS